LPVTGSAVISAAVSEELINTDAVIVPTDLGAAMVAAVFTAGSFAFPAVVASVVSAAVTTVVSVQ
jgi:hypothetical protein